MTRKANGFTLVEILVAIAVLAIALLALAATMTEGMSGIRADGRHTVANQVATSVIEDIRFGVRNPDEDSLASCALPCDESGSMEAGGQEYAYTYTIEPRYVSDSGDLQPASASDHHVLEVAVTVTNPIGGTYVFRSVVAKNP